MTHVPERARSFVCRLLVGVLVLTGAGALRAAPALAQQKPGAAPAAPPKAPPADPLAAAVDGLHKAVVAQQWKQGADLAKALFAKHEGDLRVVSRMEEIEDDLRLCLWRLERKNADLATVLGCGATKVASGTRQAEFAAVCTASASAEGWSGSENLRVFAIPFEDVEVTITTDHWYASTATTYTITRPPAVVLHYDSERSGGYLFSTDFGNAFEVSRGLVCVPFRGAIARWGDKEKDLGTGGAGTVLTGGERVTLRCSEKNGSLTMKVGDHLLRRATDSTHKSGLVALVGSAEALQGALVTLSGRVDARYLRRVQNEDEDRRFKEWQRESYARSAVIPKWVLDAEEEAAFRRAMLPSDAGPDHRVWFRQRWDELLEGKPEVLASIVPWLPKAPKLTRGYVDAVVQFALGQHAGAETSVRRILTAEPGFGPGWALLAACAWERRDRAATADALAAAKERADYHPWTWEVAASVAMDDAKFDEAQAALDAAAAHSAASPQIRDLRGVLLRLRRGPAWPKRFEAQTAHYVVASDHSYAVCAEVGAILEEARGAYRTQFRPRDDGRRARVHVFSGEETYLDYAEELGSDISGSLGVYRPRLRELCVFLHEDRRQLKDTIRHEGFHQYLHQFVNDAPIWFNEGYAEYFGFGRRKGGRHVAGEVGWTQAALVTALESEFVPLEELFVESPGAFMAAAGQRYVQSWAVIHMLRETKHPALTSLLDRYMDGLLVGLSREQVFHDVLEPVLPQLRTEFAAHLLRLKTWK
jgi:hypothetical protein